jgi:hypothetical protein
VGRLFFQDTLAYHNKDRGLRTHLQRSVVEQGDQLCGDQYRDRRFISRVVSECSKHGVRPALFQRAYGMDLHEPHEHQGVLLLILNETPGDSNETMLSELVRRINRKREKAMSFRILTKLKFGD